MGKQAKLHRQVTLTAGAVPEALRALADVRQAVLDGRSLSAVLMYLDHLAEVLLDVEGLVGVQTPQGLFMEPMCCRNGLTQQEIDATAGRQAAEGGAL